MVSSRETRLRPFLRRCMRTRFDGEAMEPSGEGGLAAETADLAEEVEEGVLGHVLGLGDVAEHAEAEGVDAAFVEGVELGKCLCVSVLGGLDRFGFADDRRISLEKTLERLWFLSFCRPWTSIARLRGELIVHR